MSNFSRGSEWRKWDLHVHTASSYDAYKGDDANDLLISAWKEKGYAAVAITDHFKIDSKRISELREKCSDITIFPGVELRTDKGSTNLHVILIFSELLDVNELENDFNVIMLRQYAKPKEKRTDENIYWDFEDIKKFAKSHNALISIHAGRKERGLDKEISNKGLFKLALKEEYDENVDIYEIGNIRDIDEYREYVFKDTAEKPLILCSDNHDPRDYKISEYLWIKANPTFEGLKETLLIPSDRVFVGDIPAKLDDVKKNKSKYIKNIKIMQKEEPINKEKWFNADINLNSGLVAVIGNKGSGKSALGDIIALACNCNTMEQASFLEKNRFRKLPENRANDYYVDILWEDAKEDKGKNLSDESRVSTIENAQYLPQRYIETVCNDLGDEFQKEINNVIFSYVDSSEKSSAHSFEELIELKSEGISIEINEISKQLNSINEEIIKLENKKTNSYKTNIEDKLNKRKDDLKRHIENKPKEVKEPDKHLDDNIKKQLDEINIKIGEEEKKREEDKEKLRILNINIDNLSTLIKKVEYAINDINTINIEIVRIFGEDKKKDYIIEYTNPLEKLNTRLGILNDEKEKFNNIILKGEEETITVLTNNKKQLLNKIGSEEKMYQKYIDDFKKWDEERKNIIGNINSEDSITYLEKKLEYINNKLDDDYNKNIENRKNLIKQLYMAKHKTTEIYKNLYSPIQTEIQDILSNKKDKKDDFILGEEDDEINFDIDMVLKKKEIGDELLEFINNGMKGIFQGKAEAKSKMNNYIEQIDFNNIESILQFIDKVFICVSEDYDASEKKIKDKIEFYNLLTQLSYIDSEYCLKMGKRKLSELSPGERGIVLLVFYLALSKEKIPLIIDQPEDNLDNQSVFSKLVPCIKEAKKNRQVIIITHNPNIAVACDAEQVIYCSMKKSTNEITYESGAIEDKKIRKLVIDVLEGTIPAFDLRKREYEAELVK